MAGRKCLNDLDRRRGKLVSTGKGNIGQEGGYMRGVLRNMETLLGNGIIYECNEHTL
jgi:hypothetical protein